MNADPGGPRHLKYTVIIINYRRAFKGCGAVPRYLSMRCSEQGLDQHNVWLNVNARHSGLSNFQHSRAHSEKFMVLPSSARNGLFMEYEIHFPQAFIWTVLYDMRRCSK